MKEILITYIDRQSHLIKTEHDDDDDGGNIIKQNYYYFYYKQYMRYPLVIQFFYQYGFFLLLKQGLEAIIFNILFSHICIEGNTNGAPSGKLSLIFFFFTQISSYNF